MGGKSTKPVVEAADVIRLLSPGDIAAMQHIYQQVAALPPAVNSTAATQQQQTAQQQQHAGKIEKSKQRQSTPRAAHSRTTTTRARPLTPSTSPPVLSVRPLH